MQHKIIKKVALSLQLNTYKENFLLNPASRNQKDRKQTTLEQLVSEVVFLHHVVWI